jgi:hypothetical protein
MPSPLILEESAYERGEAGFMVSVVKPGHVPSPERRFHRKIKEVAKGSCLESNTPDNLSVVSAWLIFQKEVIFEWREREAWRNS